MRVAEQTIDQLNIEINAKAKQGGSGMDKLIASIEKLKSVTGGGAGNLSGIAGSIKKLTDAIDGAKSKSGTLSSLARSIEKLNEIKTTQISENLTALVDSLKVLNGMDSGLKVIISDLATLAKSGTGGISGNALKLQAEAAKAQATIDRSALTSAKAQEGLKAIEEKNRKIADSARFAAEAQDSLASAVARAVKASQTGEVSDYVQSSVPITKKSTPSASFMPYDINSSIKDLQTALDGAGSTASKVTENISTGSNKASGAVGRLKEMFKSAKTQASDFGKSANTAFRTINFAGAYMLMRRGANMIGGFINNINSYIESMNLFTVSMGNAADEGSKLAHSMQDILGIDAGEASKYMGIFQQLETSFGVVNSQATTVSKNLTQLGYDIASYFNISTENSFLKLQSGLAGEVEPLRRIGFDISKARLQQELYRLGIDATVDSLSQADKSLLRYIAIMRQSTNVQGDMARTLSAPSNQLRILTAQLQIAGRAIGSIFIPALNAILPPVIAVVQIIGEAAAALAAFFGFKMPKVEFGSAGADLSGLADDAEDFASGVGDIGDSASDAAKEVRDLIGGFDELNILRADDGSSGKNKGGAGGAGGNILGGIELPEYDMLSGAVDSRIGEWKKKIQDFIEAFKADPLTVFSNALWGVGGAFDDLGKWLSSMDYADILLGISAAVMAYGLTKNPILAITVGAVTMALSKLLPKESKIDLLSGSLATLGGALVLKTFTGMPFKLALGISALVTSGLVVLIGKDNAINLLGSAMGGLGAGIMAFTFTGNLPLAIAIGAATAAISGLADHFTDLRIAPGLLAGVSAGFLAFKFGAFSKGSAGLVGLGIAVATFAELNDLSPVLTGGLLMIAGGITGVGAAIKLGFGVEGTILLAVVGAFVGLGAAIWQASKDAQRADLEGRFGSISLSAQEVEEAAERLTTTDWTVKIDAAIEAQDKVKEFEKTLKADIESLNRMNWKISIGMTLTEGEISDYKTDIENFITDAKAYVEQQHYAVTMAIEAGYEPGSETQQRLKTFANQYYLDAQNQLDNLGVQLSDVVNEAFSDGILSEGEIMKMSELERKMQEIIDKISDAEYKAKLNNLTADLSAKGLTPDSFKDLIKQVHETANDRMAKADEVRLKAKAVAELELSETGNRTAYNDAIAEADRYYNSQRAEIELTGITIGTKTLNDTFSNELKSAQPVWTSGVKTAMSNGWKVGIDESQNTYTTSIHDLVNGVSGSYQRELNSLSQSGEISGAARRNIEELVAALKPGEDDLIQIADASKKAGISVPQNVADGIADVKQMEAISGNADAINYMIGKNFSTDSTFLNTLATAKNAGKDLDANVAQGLTDNLQLVKDNASGAITGVKNAMTGEIMAITPTLKQNMSDLGFDMSGSLEKTIDGKVPDIKESGRNLSKGAFEGADEQLKKDKPKWNEWAIWPWNWFNKENEINSPSRKLYRAGEFLAQGAYEGANAKMQGSRSSWMNWAGQPLAWFENQNSNKFRLSGENLVGNLQGGIEAKWGGLSSWWQRNSKLSDIDIPSVNTPYIKLPHFGLSYSYEGWMSKALQFLGLPGLPRLSVSWYKSGGVFDEASIIGLGEYPNAKTNPEIVTPQKIMRETVDEANQAVISAINNKSDGDSADGKIVEMMRAAFASALREDGGGDNFTLAVQLDSEVIEKKVYKVQKRQGKKYVTQTE